MKQPKRRVGLVLSLLMCAAVLASSVFADTPNSVADAKGNLHVPSDYRTSYQYMGSWSIAADKEARGAKQIHSVYASPGAVDGYRKNGKWPDGAVLVKEVFETTTSDMTTGTVSKADKLSGWFVMVKDSKNSHPTNKLWGNGWGWSWFDAGSTQKTTSTDFRNDCLTCHVPAKDTDWIYVAGYPALKK
jgi:Cytochrome P460